MGNDWINLINDIEQIYKLLAVNFTHALPCKPESIKINLKK